MAALSASFNDFSSEEEDVVAVRVVLEEAGGDDVVVLGSVPTSITGAAPSGVNAWSSGGERSGLRW